MHGFQGSGIVVYYLRICCHISSFAKLTRVGTNKGDYLNFSLISKTINLANKLYPLNK